MPNNNTQQNPSQMHPDDSRAALGVATNLLQHILPQGDTQNPSETQNSAPEQEQTPQTKDNLKEEKTENMGTKFTELELSLTKKLDDISREIKDLTKEEHASNN